MDAIGTLQHIMVWGMEKRYARGARGDELGFIAFRVSDVLDVTVEEV